jgi:hypothetical protein
MSLWGCLFQLFFNMPVQYMYGSCVPPHLSANPSPLDDVEALPVHTRVITLFGVGEVLGYRITDNIYKVWYVW